MKEDTPNLDCVSAIILAGGLSRRFRRDKAIENFKGQPIIGRVIDRLAKITDEIIVVVNTYERGLQLPVPQSSKIVLDMFPNTGSLGGIFTGLSIAKTRWSIVVACDMPLININLIHHLITLRNGYDLVVPRIDNYPEPTHALYSKTCIPYMKNHLRAGNLKIAGFFDDVKVHYVSEPELSQYDPDLLSFFNINTQKDLCRANSLG